MKKFRLFKSLAIGLIFVAFIAVFTACSSGSEPQDRTFALEIANGELNLVSNTLRVNQDDTVTLNFTSDTPGSVHLHGYDIEKSVAPGEGMSIEFLADATGRFTFTFHPGAEGEEHDEQDEHEEDEEEEISLGAIEVLPR